MDHHGPSVRSKRSSPNLLHKITSDAKKNPDCIIMSLGEPEFDTQDFILDATITALKENRTKYTNIQGTLPLRQAISRHIVRKGGVEYDPEKEILVTIGGKGAVLCAAFSALDPGQKIWTPFPKWPGYNGPELIENEAIGFPMQSGKLDEGCIERAISSSLGTSPRSSDGKVRTALLVCSPNNPDGRVVSHLEQSMIIEAAKRFSAHGNYFVSIISDGVYEMFTKEDYRPFSAVDGSKERILEIGSVSKSFGMTGFRIGWLAGPSDYIEGAARAQSNFLTCLPEFVQIAACRALDASEEEKRALAKITSAYESRLEQFVRGLSTLPGFNQAPQRTPDGGFFAWIDISHFGLDSKRYCSILCNEFGVAAAPGIAFGDDTHARYSLTIPSGQLEEALNRHESFAKKYFGLKK